MSVKILGGVAKSFELATAHDSHTRPTSVMLKRRLFDSIQDFSGITFIDLCAGSGSMGLEALSRGASHVYLVENNKNSFRFLKTNAQKILQKFPDLGKLECFMDDFAKWLKKNESVLTNDEDKIIFFDPPYEKIDLYRAFLTSIFQANFHGKLIVEACQQKTLKIDSFEQEFGIANKIFKQGTSFFAIYDL